jgi:hypothetical protein
MQAIAPVRLNLMRPCLAVVAVGLLAACGQAQPDQTERVSLALTCVEQTFRAALHVDANDSRLVWATNYNTGGDVAVQPRPPGRFTFDRDRPTLLLDGGGNLVSFDGEISQTGCFDAVRQIVYFGPQDLPDPNRGPN